MIINILMEIFSLYWLIVTAFDKSFKQTAEDRLSLTIQTENGKKCSLVKCIKQYLAINLSS